MNKGIARRSVQTWVLVAASCLGGLCLAHHAPGSLLLPLPWPTPEEPMSPRLTVAVTATAFQPMQAATPTLMPTHTPGATPMPVETSAPITLTIVYDNNAFDARLKTAWGFACLVETGETTILFDTGGDGPALMDNLATLGFDPRRINAVVLSHIHGDHTGGLGALLSVNDHLAVYVPRSFPAEFKAGVDKRAHLVEVSEPMTLTDHIRTTGEMGTAIIEQSLIVETDKGLVVITGCAHPGITEIVRQAKAYGDMYLVVGGFHLKDKSIREIEAVIVELEQLGVRKIAPCHCTGEQAIRLFREAFGAGLVPAGVGAMISIRE